MSKIKLGTKSTVLGAVLLFFQAADCFAYKAAVHFYLTHTLGVWCGLDQYPYRDGMNETFAIAWGDYETDFYPETDPGFNPGEWLDFSKPELRRRFHFPVEAFGHSVIRASYQSFVNVTHALEVAQGEEPNPVLLGIGIHTLQDSWAHEGYGPEFGHMGTDEPDFPQSNVQKAMEMAENTWDILRQWSKAVHNRDCRVNFSQISGIIETWSSAYVKNGEALTEAWKKNAEAVAKRPIPVDAFFKNPEWSEQFHDASEVLP